MRIHKEGTWIIPIAAILIAGLYLLLYWLFPFLWLQVILAIAAVIFFGLIVHFFRDPNISCPAAKDIIYAPADGKLVVVEKTTEGELLKDERIQLSIFMSPLNVHVNRMPMAGKIAQYIYHKGKYLVAWHPKSSTHNERTTILLETTSGVQIVMRQIAGAVARRIRFYAGIGDQFDAGEEVGFIRFGSRVDLFLPPDAEVLASIGDLTKGGQTPLARL